jgi:hypothetical protein
MAVTASWYGKGVLHVMSGDVDMSADSMKVALTDNTYTPDVDTHEFFDTHISGEVTGTGYTAGGDAVTSQALTYVAADDRVKFTLDPSVWDPSTITARRAILYVVGSTPGTDDYLLGWVDFGQDESSSSNEFKITWSANGALRVAVV